MKVLSSANESTFVFLGILDKFRKLTFSRKINHGFGRIVFFYNFLANTL